MGDTRVNDRGFQTETLPKSGMFQRSLVLALGLALAVAVRPATAGDQGGDRAGEFAYYVLALSWSPAWCAAEGDASNAPQCEAGAETGFVLHGLWPQHRDGWPEHCAASEPAPSAAELRAVAGIMPSPGLARYQWRKHGSCSGLDPGGYFALARRAWEAVRRPAVLRRHDEPVRVAPGVVEDAFLEANPGLSPAGVTVTCRDGMIREVRICLDRGLAPRPCTGPAARECPLGAALLAGMR